MDTPRIAGLDLRRTEAVLAALEDEALDRMWDWPRPPACSFPTDHSLYDYSNTIRVELRLDTRAFDLAMQRAHTLAVSRQGLAPKYWQDHGPTMNFTMLLLAAGASLAVWVCAALLLWWFLWR